MTFHTFPIAYLRNPVNPPRSVFSITFLLPEDDTSGVIPRHAMLRHAYHVSATRNFRLTPTHQPTQLRDFRPLIPPSSYASPSSCALGHTLARRAERGSQARVDSPPVFAPPFPTHLFHVKHRRIIPAHNQERGFDTRPG